MTKLSLHSFTEKAYLDYAMYVILDRALPHIADGLKPVQRRIIYAMSELGLNATSPYKKSARTVGDVLGKFHPHGDQACYEAMVLMAQPFSYRYPFVDGQGNWGSTDDPKSFAAMRYTEARLSRYANLLLSELGEGTVDWNDNFDGTLKEPALLPAQIPNVLLNASTGIAVGMSADLLPHNLKEVLDACVYLLDHPNACLDDLLTCILGPDFPTQAELISSPSTLRAVYETGTGSVRLRATYQVETAQNDLSKRKGQVQHKVVINALPYQVSGAKVLTQIADQMQNKRLNMLQDLRDESDHDTPTRLVLLLKPGEENIPRLMSHLFSTTDLERSYRVNMNVVGLDGKPAVKPLLPLMKEWLEFRLSTLRRRLNYHLAKIEARLHLLEGFFIAFLNIDEVIRIIREEDEPKPVLMAHFKLSEKQADAILDLKLRHLAKLEEMSLTKEREALEKKQKQIQKALSTPAQLSAFLKKELLAISQAHQDARQTLVVEREAAKAMDDEQSLDIPLTVALSEKGWVKVIKGHNIDTASITYKKGDGLKQCFKVLSGHLIYVFDTTGRVYTIPAHAFPLGKPQGEPLSAYFHFPEGETVHAMQVGVPEDWVLLASVQGYGFACQLGSLFVKNKKGKACLSLTQGLPMLAPQYMGKTLEGFVVCISQAGRLLLFPSAELTCLARGKGTKLMHVKSAEQDLLAHISWVPAGASLKVYAGKRHFQLSSADLERYTAARGRRGALLPRGLQSVTQLEVIVSSPS